MSREATETFNKAAAKVSNLFPEGQFRVLVGLVGAYIMFWYLSRY
jgi:hypothetical protein